MKISLETNQRFDLSLKSPLNITTDLLEAIKAEKCKFIDIEVEKKVIDVQYRTKTGIFLGVMIIKKSNGGIELIIDNDGEKIKNLHNLTHEELLAELETLPIARYVYLGTL
ncbi:hypothetical protein SHAb15599_00042 [Acinetobacter phage SH-Ab 15599]|nr:hypothetical protein SHAb15599_00042 [Acinetobacter phage SH-Ab 15599]